MVADPVEPESCGSDGKGGLPDLVKVQSEQWFRFHYTERWFRLSTLRRIRT